MASMAELEAIVASIGVEAKESEVRFRRKMEEFTKGLEASRAEFDRRLAEADKRRAEAERAFAESRAEADKRLAEFDRRLAEADKRWVEISKRWDEVGHSEDKICSQVDAIDDDTDDDYCYPDRFFQNIFRKTLIFNDEEYDYIRPSIWCRNRAGVIFTIDILLFNSKNVVLIDAGREIHPDFVQEMATKKIRKFRKFFPEYQKHKVYLGIAGFSFCKDVLDKAQKFGVGIIKQVGDSVEIDAEHLKAY